MKTKPVNRRKFLKQSGAVVAIGAVAPYILASDKSGSRLPIMGDGENQYEAIHDWGELPPGHVYGNTHGVAVDSQGLVYIKHTVGAGAKVNDAIVVFDPDGKFVRSWGSQYKGGAHGLHLSREGNEEFFYMCDPKRHLFAKHTHDGKELWRQWAPEECDGYNAPDEFCPTNTAVAPNGDFYISDGYGKSYIHQYDKDAKYIRSFAGKGKDAGKTDCPHGLMVDLRGDQPSLVVADRSNHRLQYFNLDGQHQSFVTDEMHSPCHFHTRGDMMVIPDLDSVVTLVDKNNKLIAHLGQGPGYNGLRNKTRNFFPPGQFVAPHSAYFDHEGNIFIVEWVEVGRVTKLRKLA